MSSDKTYKDLLAKLVAGTISDKEKWQLERASLDDPFLADAIEGYYEQKPADDNLTALRDRIESKKPKRKTRSLFFRNISVAASLLLLLGASFWMFNTISDPLSVSVAENATTMEVEHEPQAAPSSKTANKGMGGFSKKGVEEETAEVNKTRIQTQRIEDVDFAPERAKQTTRETIEAKQPTKIAEQVPQASNTVSKKSSTPPTEILADAPAVVREKKANRQAPQPSAKRKAEAKSIEESAPITEEESDQIATEEESVIIDGVEVEYDADMTSDDIGVSQSSGILANSSPIEKLPSIIQGQVTGLNGLPLAGVDIFDLQANKIGTSNAQGQFSLPYMEGYVVAAFTGYDSTTIAITPQLSVALQPSQKLLSQPLQTQIQLMTDQMLITKYINDLNRLFSKNWPLCNQQQFANDPFSRINSTTVFLTIDNRGQIADMTYMNELNEECQRVVKGIFREAVFLNTFAENRPVAIRYRINF